MAQHRLNAHDSVLGGKASARALTPEQRSKKASDAAKVRWKGHKKQKAATAKKQERASA